MRLTAEYTSGVFVIVKFFLCCCFLNLRLAFGTFLLGSKTTGCTEGSAHVWAINPVVPWRMATLPAQNPQPQGTLGDSGITWDIQSEMNPALTHRLQVWGQKGEEMLNFDLPQKG